MSLANGCCPGTVGGLAISAGVETPVSSGTVVFSNANGITFGMIGSTITASAFITASASAGLNSLSAGTTFATGPGVSLANSNGLSFGANGNTITGSFAAVRAISGGTTLASGGTIVLSNANGVSFGVNGNTVTASVSSQPTQTITVFSQWAEFGTNFTVWPGVASFQKVSMPMGVSGSSGAIIMEMLGNSDSSGGVTLHVGAYRMTASTASNLSSRSAGFTWTSGSDTTAASLYGGASGTRYRSFPWDVAMTPGDYLFAFAISTTNDGTCRILGRQGVNIVGTFVGFETNYFVDGYTNSSVNPLPDTIVANNTNYVRTGLSALRQPGFILFGTN